MSNKLDISINKIKREAAKCGVDIKPCKNTLLNGQKCWSVRGVLYTRENLIAAYFHDDLY